MVEILTNFSFYVYFLAAIWLSAVPLYADENQITTSASKCDSPLGCKLFARLSAASGGGRAFGAEGGEAQIPPAEGGKQKKETTRLGGFFFVLYSLNRC